MKYQDFSSVYKLMEPLTKINFKGISRLSKFVSALLIPKPGKGGAIIKTIHNFYLLVDPVKDNGVERSLYYLGTYERGTLHIIGSILRPGDFFIDIGANIGLMSIYASGKVGNKGKVLSFEANPETKKILDKNISLNNISNIQISGFALGSAKGTGNIYINWHMNRGAASLIKNDQSTDFFPVEIIRLDEFEMDYPSNVRLIKLDIEGYELEALKGCGNLLKGNNAPMLIIECSSGRKNFESGKEDLYKYLKSINNYRIFKLRKNKEKESPLIEITAIDELPYHDNIFCFLPHQVSTLPKEIF